MSYPRLSARRDCAFQAATVGACVSCTPNRSGRWFSVTPVPPSASRRTNRDVQKHAVSPGSPSMADCQVQAAVRDATRRDPSLRSGLRTRYVIANNWSVVKKACRQTADLGEAQGFDTRFQTPNPVEDRGWGPGCKGINDVRSSTMCRCGAATCSAPWTPPLAYAVARSCGSGHCERRPES